MPSEEYMKKRRDAVVARHKVLESVQGSGWNQNDPQAREEARNGMSPISTRPVALQHDNRVYFVAEDVQTVRDALSRYVARHKADRKAVEDEHVAAGVDLPETTPAVRESVGVAARVAAETDPVIGLFTNEFNACLLGFKVVGLTIVSTGVIG